MITDVYIIRKDMDKFFVLDSESDNWEWSKNLDEATIFSTPDKAQQVKLQRKTGDDTYIYQMPYSITQPQQRKKRKSKKLTGRIIKKGKPMKRK